MYIPRRSGVKVHQPALLLVVLRGSNLRDPWRMAGRSGSHPRLVLNLESIMQTPVVKAPSCASWVQGEGGNWGEA